MRAPRYNLNGREQRLEYVRTCPIKRGCPAFAVDALALNTRIVLLYSSCLKNRKGDNRRRHRTIYKQIVVIVESSNVYNKWYR